MRVRLSPQASSCIAGGCLSRRRRRSRSRDVSKTDSHEYSIEAVFARGENLETFISYRQSGMPAGRRHRAHIPVSYTHLRAHETRHDLVCRLLLEKKKKK